MKVPLHELFNDPAEVHAFIHGLFKGMFERQAVAEVPDSVKEVHYFRAGYILGWLLDYKLTIPKR